MDFNTFIQEKDIQRSRQNYISFTKGELLALSDEQTSHLIDYFHGYTMMRLPETEQAFFEWLKKNDVAVWDDLWGTEEDLYMASIDLLRNFTGRGGGFPICDLLGIPNYWFTKEHIKPKGLEALQEIITLAETGAELDTEQQFLLQISVQNTDLWHFCFMFGQQVADMKKAVEKMVYKGWIVHLPDREDLVKYITF
ncbi:MAG TPA: hypothetical protein EYP36_12385 [Calditrichaeota bacterium]|nr:hypothetical protein [Calditrichota bacterium]